MFHIIKKTIGLYLKMFNVNIKMFLICTENVDRTFQININQLLENWLLNIKEFYYYVWEMYKIYEKTGRQNIFLNG